VGSIAARRWLTRLAYSVWFADSAEIGSMKAEPVLSVW
jgi:hypothetical protein